MDIWTEVLKLADKSLESGDVPVGAIIIKENRIIGVGYNTREKFQKILGHAEINAIIAASEKVGKWNLQGSDMYVSLKPCQMCMEVIKQSRISNVYYLLEKPTNKKEYDKCNFQKIDNKENEGEYSIKIATFFQKLREK